MNAHEIGYLRDTASGNAACTHPPFLILVTVQMTACRLCGAIMSQQEGVVHV